MKFIECMAPGARDTTLVERRIAAVAQTIGHTPKTGLYRSGCDDRLEGLDFFIRTPASR